MDKLPAIAESLQVELMCLGGCPDVATCAVCNAETGGAIDKHGQSSIAFALGQWLLDAIELARDFHTHRERL